MKYWTQSVGALKIFDENQNNFLSRNLSLLPASSAGDLSGEDVPGLAGCIQCVLQGDGISCRSSKLNVHFIIRNKKS